MNHFVRDSELRETAPWTVAMATVGATPAARSAPPASSAPAHSVRVLADDDEAAARWCERLHGEGLQTQAGAAAAGAGGADSTPLAVVLHISGRLPDSLGLLRQLRARDGAMPLIVVCQQLRDLDHVLALEMGADDVLDGATSAAVVAARLRSLTRRAGQAMAAPAGPDQLEFGALALCLRERRVQLRGRDIALTEGEFEVLWLLAAQAGRAVSRTELLRRLRGLPYQRIDRSIPRISRSCGASPTPAPHSGSRHARPGGQPPSI